MLYIDSNKMLIKVTRGDTVSIVFSATDSGGNTWVPSEGDILTFAVAKKVGGEPFISISNTYDGSDTSAFWTIEIGSPGSDDWYQKDDGEVVTDDGEPVLVKFGDYVWDLQVETSSGTITIIGKTDEISPTFRVWGEVA